MRFAFTEEQRALAEAVRDLLDKECPPESVRSAWDAPGGLAPGLWSKLAEMGVLGLLVPEASGGLGMTTVDAVLAMYECGRAGVPDPVVETAYVAPPLLAAAGRDELGARIASGELVVAAAPASMPFFDHAAVADRLLLFGRHRDAGLRFATLLDPAEVELVPYASVDGARRLAKARVGVGLGDAGELLDVDGAAVGAAFDRGSVGLAAFLLGLADRMLELTVGYVKERHQFGVPIGSFQAVKHHAADALSAVEMAKPVVWRAAWSLAHRDAADPDVAVHASMAKACASDAASTVARLALQCHAAIGYTVEYDLHLYMKRTWALARVWGDAGWHRERIAAIVVDESGEEIE